VVGDLAYRVAMGSGYAPCHRGILGVVRARWNKKLPALTPSDWKVGVVVLLTWLAFAFCVADLLGYL